MTYDTDLDTNTEFFASGSSVGGYTALTDFYGYSASGITSMSVGGWTTSEILDRNLPSGSSAALWFDADIAVAAPTLMALRFVEQWVGFEMLGGAFSYPSEIRLVSGASFEDPSGFGFTPSITVTSSVPEPTTALLLTLGLAGLGMRRRH